MNYVKHTSKQLQLYRGENHQIAGKYPEINLAVLGYSTPLK
jgi:hypothetical protein